MRVFLAFLLWLLTPGLAHAAWHEVSSDHFVVYADSSEANLRRFSEQLERYHSAMAYLTQLNDAVPSPSNRVTIYVVGSEGEVRKLMGGKNRNVAGFYRPRAGGSLAVIPSVSSKNSGDLVNFSMAILLHEYAHHFLITNSSFAVPRWAAEGAAEFFAAASFGADGSVRLGRPSDHRAAELAFAKDVTATDLLDPELYEKRRGKGQPYDAFYGKAWLLYHYLSFEPARKGQLRAYYDALSKGQPLREAGAAVFGDFKQLEKELDAYAQRPKLFAYTLKPALLSTGKITLRPLRPGEVAILPVRQRSRVGVSKETAPAVLKDARAVAAKFGSDPAVQAALAEAEFDAGNDREAIAAADAAILIDPGQANAYIQKGYALLRRAADSGDAKAFQAARAPFLALNKLENDHPLPLLYFYLTYARQGQKPPANAVLGLERASQLAPFDFGLRMTVAMQQVRDGLHDAALANLTPVALNPHGGGLAEFARKTIERIKSEPAWRGQGSNADLFDEEGEGDEPPKSRSPNFL